MELFGLEIKKKENDEKLLSFTTQNKDDGAIEIDADIGGVGYNGHNGYYFDIDQIPENEYELINLYRFLALQLEIDEALQEIVNEAIISDDLKQSVSVNMDETELSDNIKTKINDEFNGILKLLKFKSNGFGIFKKWYVDGRLYYHKIVDSNNVGKGILDLIPIDPLNIKLIREIKKERTAQTTEASIYNVGDVNEYYLYSETPMVSQKSGTAATGLRIHKDAITLVSSGLLDINGRNILSYLYKSIKPFNNLRLLEDSVVIYRVSRAPERRVFYVDVGNLPTGKAEQYVKDLMNRFKKKIVYDVNKGSIENRKHVLSTMEDFWLPRREGGRGTEVDTLPGGENLGELGDVEYFKSKLYRSLNVPLSRFNSDELSQFNIGRSTEITRDEIKFNKFISRLRSKFSELFRDLLGTQLILKRIMTNEEWLVIKEEISFMYLEDNYFAESKEMEILQDRLNVYDLMNNAGVIGKFYSNETVQKHILRQTDEEIKEERKKIESEQKDEIFNPVEEEPDEGGRF